MTIQNILGGAPVWVYFLLAVLIVLGIRRLRDREMPVAVALLPVVAFTVWGGFGAGSYAASVGWPLAALVWLGGALAGAASYAVAPEPRGVLLPANRVRQPGSSIPLISYVLVFIVRFGCGAWAAIDPSNALVATGIGVAAGAMMTARLLIAAARWHRVSPTTLA